MAEFDIMKLLAGTKAEARPYQQRIVNRVVTSLTPEDKGGRGMRSILINSPTGSGKTIMSLLINKAIQEREDCLIGWVSMRRNLLVQAASENNTHSKLNPRGKSINANIDFISMFEKNMPAHLLPANRNGRKLLLTVDEAQHDAANSCAHIHAVLRPDFILGMTATPFRTDRVKLCFDSVINDAGIGALIREGYLAPYEHYTIPKWSVQGAIETYLREPNKWGKSIFYFHTIEQCMQARAMLESGMGGKYQPVTNEMVTGSSDREPQLERFRLGQSRTIVNCMVLTEGFDCPDLETVFLRPSCKGVTIQMAGRVFRRHHSIPVKKVVQCEKTKWPFMKTADPVCSYRWELPKDGFPGQWLSLTPNKFINEMNCNMVVALAGLNTPLPEFMVTKKMTARGRRAKKRL